MKQTAVEWLVEQLKEQIIKSAHNKLGTNRTGDYRIGLSKAIDFCEQAKEMEKEQIIDTHTRAYLIGECDISKQDGDIVSTKYYNQTFKKD